MITLLLAVPAFAQDLTLDVPTLIAGETADVVIEGLDPSETVFLVRGGSVGPGACPAALGGSCLDVTGVPQVAGAAIADGAGVALVTLTLPSGSVGASAGLQAVAIRGGVDSAFSDAQAVSVEPSQPCPIYINDLAAPGGTGTVGAPYATIQEALDARGTCESLMLEPGVYPEQIDATGHTAVIESTNGPTVTRLTAVTTPSFLISTGNADITLRGIAADCTNATVLTYGISVVDSAITLENSSVDDCDTGLSAQPGKITITDSSFRGNTTAVSTAYDRTELTVTHSEFTDNIDDLELWGGELHIEGNQFNHPSSPWGYGRPAVTVSDANLTFVNNVVACTDLDGGLEVTGLGPSLIAHNTILAPSAWGIEFIDDNGAVRFVNNNVVSGAIAIDTLYGVSGWPTMENNNIFPNNVFGPGSPVGLAGNISADPLFVPGSYVLQAASSCVDAGLDLSADGIVDDVDGTARPLGAGYDIGAYESW